MGIPKIRNFLSATQVIFYTHICSECLWESEEDLSEVNAPQQYWRAKNHRTCGINEICCATELEVGQHLRYNEIQ